MTLQIFTVGYEGVTEAEFLDALKGAGVKRVIEVRALPLSRRPGFSKTPLRNALAEIGINYVHLKALGTPPEGRDGAEGATCRSKADLCAATRIARGDLCGRADARTRRRAAERLIVLRTRTRGVSSFLAAEGGG